jgi:hypothetical protein
MFDWIVVGGIVWLALVAAVIFLALGRISAAMSDQRLTRAGLNRANPLHLRLRHVIQTEDRVGISLTILVAICSVVLGFLLANQIFRDAVHKMIQVLTF